MWRGVRSGRQAPHALAVALAVLVLFTGGLTTGPAQAHAGSHASGEEHAVHVFSMKNFRFTPTAHTAHVEDTVQWKNLDEVVHHIVSDDGNINTGDILPGESWSWTANAPGTVTFRCKYHSDMRAKVDIEPARPPNNPPTVKILEPADGAEVAGYVTIKGTSDDPDGDWLKVYVRVDGGKWRRIETSTLDWEIGWNTGVLKNGEHTIEAAAWDKHGEYSLVDKVTVFVMNAEKEDAKRPSVFLTEPVSRSRVSGEVIVKGLSGDGTGAPPDVQNESDWIVKVRWDRGEWVQVPGKREWTATLDSRNLTNGPHTIEAVTVLDGHTSPSATVQVFVYNDAADPVRVQITSPLERERVNGTVSVRGTAYDPESQPVTVLVRVDGGEWQRATGANPWVLPLATSHFANGPHLVEAMARTDTRSSAIAKVTIFTDNGERVERPRVRITSPEENAQLAGIILVRGEGENPSGRPFTVQFRVDGGAWEAVSGTTRWAFTLDTTALPNGVHHLQARAFDDQSYSAEYDHRILVANAPKPVDTSRLGGDDELTPLVPSTGSGTQSKDAKGAEDDKGVPTPGLALALVACAAAAGVLDRSRRARGR